MFCANPGQVTCTLKQLQEFEVQLLEYDQQVPGQNRFGQIRRCCSHRGGRREQGIRDTSLSGGEGGSEECHLLSRVSSCEHLLWRRVQEQGGRTDPCPMPQLYFNTSATITATTSVKCFATDPDVVIYRFLCFVFGTQKSKQIWEVHAWDDTGTEPGLDSVSYRAPPQLPPSLNLLCILGGISTPVSLLRPCSYFLGLQGERV